MRRGLTYTIFPAVFGAALLATWWMLAEGVAAATVVFSVSAGAALVITLLERWMPYDDTWSKSRGDVPTDLVYAIFSLFAAPRLFDTLALAALVPVSASLAEGGTWWPADLPWILQLLLAVVIGELGAYWWHRLMHERALLFRLHATHHSPGRLYWLNAGRFHPLDTTLLFVLGMTPLTLLGAGPEVMLLFTVWVSVHGLFQHCNIRLRLGPLNYIFSMAELHRWHHSLKLEEANANYGNNIIFWDLVFGTLHHPKGVDASSKIGLSGLSSFPTHYLGQVLAPWRWNRIERQDSPNE